MIKRSERNVEQLIQQSNEDREIFTQKFESMERKMDVKFEKIESELGLIKLQTSDIKQDFFVLKSIFTFAVVVATMVLSRNFTDFRRFLSIIK